MAFQFDKSRMSAPAWLRLLSLLSLSLGDGVLTWERLCDVAQSLDLSVSWGLACSLSVEGRNPLSEGQLVLSVGPPLLGCNASLHHVCSFLLKVKLCSSREPCRGSEGPLPECGDG